MRSMNLKTSVVLIAVAIFFAGLARQVQACPPTPRYHNPCGQYGCVNGLPAYVPGIGGGTQTQTTTQTTSITIINK
jgi:hypothetical protein